MSQVKCPKCGSRHLQVVVRQLAEVSFTEDGDHEVTDGPYGDDEDYCMLFDRCTVGEARQQFIDETRRIAGITEADVAEGDEYANVYITTVLRSASPIAVV